MRLRSSLLWLVVVAVVPVTAIAFIVVAVLIDREQGNFIRAVKDRNRAFMSAVDEKLMGHVRTLDAISSIESLRNDELRAFHAAAVAALATQREWENLILNATDGRQLVNAAIQFGEPLPTQTDRDSVRQVVETRKPLIVSLRIRPITNTLAIPVRVPVVRDGRVTYVLTAVVRPESFEGLMRQQELPTGWVSGLVDDENRFIARVPPRPVGSRSSPDFAAALASSREGWYRGRTAEGFDTYTAFLKSDLSNWAIGVAIPTELVAAAQRATWLLALAIGALFIVSLAVAAAIARRIATPIGSLAASVAKMEENPSIEIHSGIDEVRRLAVAFRGASQAVAERQALAERERRLLEESDRAKDEFLAMLSHELRNPLAGIATASQLLKALPAGGDLAVSALAIIERQTRHMTRLVEELLDVSRITVGKAALDLRPIDLADVVNNTVDTWRQSGRLDAHRIVVDAQGSVWVMGDRSRIDQIFANLLDNAMKFSPPGSEILIAVKSEERSGTLVVRDSGSGIPDDQLVRIFDLFVQGPQNASRSLGGLGIGLAVAKRLVQLHGGTITAQSDGVGKGSTFTVSLPLAQRPPAEPAQDEEEHRSGDTAPAKVLLIEDNDDVRTAMADLLRTLGHDVQTASTGVAGVSQAMQWLPELVLIDIGLPDIDGYEVARRIRAGGLGALLVAVSGYGQQADKMNAMAAGFSRHVTKPLSLYDLEELLAQTRPVSE